MRSKSVLLMVFALSDLNCSAQSTTEKPYFIPAFRSCSELKSVYSKVLKQDKQKAKEIHDFAKSNPDPNNKSWAASADAMAAYDAAQEASIAADLKCKME